MNDPYVIYEDKAQVKSNKSDKNSKQDKQNDFSLLGSFDGETVIRAVVMSEVLGKPRAKRKLRGR
jgi:hypothetical protein